MRIKRSSEANPTSLENFLTGIDWTVVIHQWQDGKSVSRYECSLETDKSRKVGLVKGPTWQSLIGMGLSEEEAISDLAYKMSGETLFINSLYSLYKYIDAPILKLDKDKRHFLPTYVDIP